MNTNHGTCGLCHRSFKVTKNGGLALHGYRSHGPGVSVAGQACPGSHALPIEVSDQSLRNGLAAIERHVERTDEHLERNRGDGSFPDAPGLRVVAANWAGRRGRALFVAEAEKLSARIAAWKPAQ